MLQGFVDVGYGLPLRHGVLEPFASLTTVRAGTDAFAETEGGAAAVSGQSVSETVTVATLGARFEARPVDALSLRGSLGWRNASGDIAPEGRHAFEGGDVFTVLGARQSGSAAVADVEAQWRVARNTTSASATPASRETKARTTRSPAASGSPSRPPPEH